MWYDCNLCILDAKYLSKKRYYFMLQIKKMKEKSWSGKKWKLLQLWSHRSKYVANVQICWIHAFHSNAHCLLCIRCGNSMWCFGICLLFDSTFTSYQLSSQVAQHIYRIHALFTPSRSKFMSNVNIKSRVNIFALS